MVNKPVLMFLHRHCTTMHYAIPAMCPHLFSLRQFARKNVLCRILIIDSVGCRRLTACGAAEGAGAVVEMDTDLMILNPLT